jgi:exonuclease VII small subunit
MKLLISRGTHNSIYWWWLILCNEPIMPSYRNVNMSRNHNVWNVLNTDTLFLEMSILVILSNQNSTARVILELIQSLNYWEREVTPDFFLEALHRLIDDTSVKLLEGTDELESSYSITDRGLERLKHHRTTLRKRNLALSNILYENGYGLIELKRHLQQKRAVWRRIRSRKLERKEELLRQEVDARRIKKDSIYKKLEKEQSQLSKKIKHIERKLNRKQAYLNRPDKQNRGDHA